MGKFRDFGSRVAKLARQTRSVDYREIGSQVATTVFKPKFLPQGEVTRISQIVALICVPVVIIITLPIIVALSEVFSGLLQEPLGNYLGLFQFLSTLVSLGLFVMGAYFWFLFVITGGFKLFEF